ncbi:glutaredoxin 3 [Magnetofaba australis]|uniref:Glutaredoxin n=1 Tax=Magnetofaba australis IT-1 TaxID=1434232 RepID=A0A1Y2K2B3_9PROT|nr:glutaredoxin 3 [Magnetofaba australis]OSM02181.1 putative glutaredoxin 3 [Magnetofaba australis IT-1]
MPQVTVYTTTVCPYCVRAKMLLQKKGASYEEVNLDKEPGRRDEMLSKSGGKRTVPQIFIGDKHVGGCDDLYELELDGELDGLLAD